MTTMNSAGNMSF